LEASSHAVAIPCIHQERKGFPRELAVHISLRTIRRFLESHSSAPSVILAIEASADIAVYDAFLPLYFPRSDDEALVGACRLPQDIGDQVTGAPHFPDRDVRVKALPGGGSVVRATVAKEVLSENGTGLNINRSSYASEFDAPFTAMRCDVAASSRADDPNVAAALLEGKYVAAALRCVCCSWTRSRAAGTSSR
jgi:hypothetical protein